MVRRLLAESEDNTVRIPTRTRRWLKLFNVSLASENKQRALAKETIGGDANLNAEMTPFAFSSGKGGPDQFRETPFVYVPNLIAKVADG